jgi:Ca2+/H+ antiporter, TMEM165/GDT1 family
MFELSFAAFAASFLFVVLAEMGDKTQLLAMSFAARFNAYKVLLAVFLATVLNHAIAVAVGQLLTTVIPIDIISFAASLSFIGFGIWTARGDKLNGQTQKPSRFGPVATVGLAFFIAEFGDKTQLATISLAAQYQNPVSVLAGTTLGMLIADGVGIIVGVVLCRRIPQRGIKLFSAVIFVIFGLFGVYEVLSTRIDMIYTAFAILLLAALSVYAIYRFSKNKQVSIEASATCKTPT